MSSSWRTAFSGWLSETDRFFGVGWVEAVHAGGANPPIGLIVLHVGGVILSSLMHGENLIRAMITGRKPVETLDLEDRRRTREAAEIKRPNWGTARRTCPPAIAMT